MDEYEEYIERFMIEGNPSELNQFDDSSEEDRHILDMKIHGLELELSKANTSRNLLLKDLENAKIREQALEETSRLKQQSLEENARLREEILKKEIESMKRIYDAEKRCYEMQLQLLSYQNHKS